MRKQRGLVEPYIQLTQAETKAKHIQSWLGTPLDSLHQSYCNSENFKLVWHHLQYNNYRAAGLETFWEAGRPDARFTLALPLDVLKCTQRCMHHKKQDDTIFIQRLTLQIKKQNATVVPKSIFYRAGRVRNLIQPDRHLQENQESPSKPQCTDMKSFRWFQLRSHQQGNVEHYCEYYLRVKSHFTRPLNSEANERYEVLLLSVFICFWVVFISWKPNAPVKEIKRLYKMQSLIL